MPANRCFKVVGQYFVGLKTIPDDTVILEEAVASLGAAAEYAKPASPLDGVLRPRIVPILSGSGLLLPSIM
jgi:hypothetical protein